jgi:hypothetical protein
VDVDEVEPAGGRVDLVAHDRAAAALVPDVGSIARVDGADRVAADDAEIFGHVGVIPRHLAIDRLTVDGREALLHHRDVGVDLAQQRA